MKGNSGKVFLVGAGPGDPGLMTLRGAELLASCDVIVMDALVNPAVIANVKGRVIDVGKRGRSRLRPGHGPRQSEINDLLIRLARSGKTVVRLKGGDPFVFGRGSEEIETLRRRKIPYEIVPGVTSAVAAPAYAGIPVTDRRWASQVTFVTGHETAEAREAGGVDWEKISPHGTLVILMGVAGWPSIAAHLLHAGWSSRTPVAAIERAATSRQRVLRANLKDSAREFELKDLAAPAVIVVGAVAALTDDLAWFQRERPLFGRRIVVTRLADPSDGLSSLLSAEGVEVIRCPLIDVRPIPVSDPVRKAVDGGRFDWIIFLSANAVRHFSALGDHSVLKRIARVAVVGPQTAEAARSAGWKVSRISPNFNSKAILSSIGGVHGKSILIPRALGAPDAPVPALRKAGATITVAPIYETRQINPGAQERSAVMHRSDAITFLSSSTVESFCKAFSRKERAVLFRRAFAVSIGEMTTRSLRRAGIRNVTQATVSSRAGMISTLRRLFVSKQTSLLTRVP